MLQDLHGLAKTLLDPVLVALTGQFAHQTNAHTAHVRLHRRADNVRHGIWNRRGITRVVPADGRVEQGSIHHRPRARPGLIQARGQCDQSETRYSAVGRLHPHRAGDSRRLADGATGVRADGERRLKGRDSGC